MKKNDTTIKLKAPAGYQYLDQKTNRRYSEVVINLKERGRFVLVPAPAHSPIEY